MPEDADEKTEAREEESFLLSILPFAGLGFLLLLAIVWKYIPEREPPPPVDVGKMIIESWENESEVEIPVTDADFARGPEEAPVTIVGFSDFECPYCRIATIEVDNVLGKFGNDVRFVFKNLPLDTACNNRLRQPLHRNACEAAVMARCAGRQDQQLFWAVHDAFYRSDSLSQASLLRVPDRLELDAEALEACVASGEPLEDIQRDIDLAYGLGVTGTPTFFVNGRRLKDYRDGLMVRLVGKILGPDQPAIN